MGNHEIGKLMQELGCAEDTSQHGLPASRVKPANSAGAPRAQGLCWAGGESGGGNYACKAPQTLP
jgi:hypothetical protein